MDRSRVVARGESRARWMCTDRVAFASNEQQAAPARPQRTHRRATVAAMDNERATRRSALVAFTAAATMAAKSAMAITIPSQASSGGLGRESGIAFSSTAATSSGYTLEGTSKLGMSVKTKRGTLAAARKAAEAEAGVAAPAGKKK